MTVPGPLSRKDREMVITREVLLAGALAYRLDLVGPPKNAEHEQADQWHAAVIVDDPDSPVRVAMVAAIEAYERAPVSWGPDVL